MTAEELEAGKDFGRYLDVDGDGIPYRTYPGTHPTKGSFFTRGTSRDRYARYTEDGPAYADNMQRLLRKFETAKDLVPRPLQANARQADQIRRDLLRLDLARDGRGDRHAGGARPPARPAAHPRLPVPFQRGELHRRPRLRLRGRAEPRRAAALADRQRDTASIRCGWFRSCTTTARRSPRASSPRRIGDHQDQLKVTPLRKVVS